MKSANLAIKQRGNNFAVRIPAAVAKAAQIELDQPIQVIADKGQVIIKPIGPAKPSLAQKLIRFDPARHGSEAMATRDAGAETGRGRVCRQFHRTRWNGNTSEENLTTAFRANIGAAFSAWIAMKKS